MKRTKRARATERIADREDIAEDENLPPPRRVRRKRRGGKVPGKKAERRIDRRARGGATVADELWRFDKRGSMVHASGEIDPEVARRALIRPPRSGAANAGTPHRRGGPVARRPIGGAVGQSEAEPSPLVDEQGAPAYEVFPQQRDGLQWGDRESTAPPTPSIEHMRQQELADQQALGRAAEQARRASRYNGLATGGRSPRRR